LNPKDNADSPIRTSQERDAPVDAAVAAERFLAQAAYIASDRKLRLRNLLGWSTR